MAHRKYPEHRNTGGKIEQQFQFFPDERNKLVLNVKEIDAKGQKAWEYTFYGNDFNDMSGEMDVNRDKLALKFTTINGEDMVKIFKDGEQQKFNKSFELYATDPKVALDILSAFKTAFGKSPQALTSTSSSSSSDSQKKAPKTPSSKKSEVQNCKPFFEGTNVSTNEKATLYGGTYTTSGGKAFFTDEDESIVFAVGYLNDNVLIVWIQYSKNYYKDSRSPIKDLVINKDEKLNVITSKGGLTFNAVREERSDQKTTFAGINTSIQQGYYATKEQIIQLVGSSITSIKVNFSNTSSFTGNVNDKYEEKLKEQFDCFLRILN